MYNERRTVKVDAYCQVAREMNASGVLKQGIMPKAQKGESVQECYGL